MNAPETTDELLERELLERLLLHPRKSEGQPPPGSAEDEPGECDLSDPDAGNAD